MNRYVTVQVDTEAEVDLQEILADLPDSDIADLAEARGFQIHGHGKGDLRTETIIERAYLAARQMSNTPREIADLLWHVHGRAI